MSEESSNPMMMVVIVVFVLAALVGIYFGLPHFHTYNAKRQGDINEQYLIQNANVRVSSYEWFYTMHDEIIATRKKAVIAKGEPEEKGIRMVLASMIAEYNAKSRMTVTKAQWKARDLPYQIEE